MNFFKVLCVIALSFNAFPAWGANKLIFSNPPKASYAPGEKIYFSWNHSESKAPTLLAIMKDGKRTTGVRLKKDFNSYAMPAAESGKYIVMIKGADKKVITKRFSVGKKTKRKLRAHNKNKFKLLSPTQDVTLSDNEKKITFKWDAKIDEPSILFLKVRGKTYKIPLKANEREKTIKLGSMTQLEWWLGGKKTRTLSPKKSIRISMSKNIAKSKQTDKNLFIHFGLDTRSNSQSFDDEEDPIEGVEGSVSFGGVESIFFQRAYKSPLKCYPQGGFHYSTALSSGEDEVSLKDFSAFGAEINCAYALTPLLAGGPSIAVESLPFFIQKDNELEGGSFQAVMVGGRLDLNGKLRGQFDYLTGVSAHATSGVLKYAGNMDLIWNYFRLPLLLGVKYTSFSTSTEELEGYQSSILSTRFGLSIDF